MSGFEKHNNPEVVSAIDGAKQLVGSLKNLELQGKLSDLVEQFGHEVPMDDVDKLIHLAFLLEKWGKGTGRRDLRGE